MIAQSIGLLRRCLVCRNDRIGIELVAMRHHFAAQSPLIQRTPDMPIYEFECPACAHRFERLQKLADADPKDCPECGKSGVRRRLTAPAFRLSGSGWYETDFKKEGDVKRNLASSESAPASAPAAEGSAAGKTETAKSEVAKPESKPSPLASS
jgi:putative FmdB family regulatory protein